MSDPAGLGRLTVVRDVSSRGTVDRAGFDEVESSAAGFRQTAGLLRQAIAARLSDRALEAEARVTISTW